MHSVIHYQLWYQVLEWFKWIIDLPNLNSIKLGKWGLGGSYVESCSLIMESGIEVFYWWIDLPNLTSITSTTGSFEDPRSVTFSSNMLYSWILNRYS